MILLLLDTFNNGQIYGDRQCNRQYQELGSGCYYLVVVEFPLGMMAKCWGWIMVKGV